MSIISALAAATSNSILYNLSYDLASGTISWNVLPRGVLTNVAGQQFLASNLRIVVTNNQPVTLGSSETSGPPLNTPAALTSLSGTFVQTVVPGQNPYVSMYSADTHGTIIAVYATAFAQ